MQVGETWAYRERSSDPNCPFVEAEIVQFGPAGSQKVRVRWHGGEYPGLEEWVTRGRLCVEWEHAKAWLRDERLLEVVRVASLDELDSVEHEAAQLVLSVHPIPDGILPGYGRVDGANVEVRPWPSALADLDVDVDELLAAPDAFVDRHGVYHAPWPVTLQLAHAVIAKYADRVLAEVAKDEGELQDRATRGWSFDTGRGKDQRSVWIPPELCVEELEKRRPMFGLVRSWCGVEASEQFDRNVGLAAEVARLRGLAAEVARLRGLVEEAARRFEAADMKYDARFFRRSLDPAQSTAAEDKRRSRAHHS